MEDGMEWDIALRGEFCVSLNTLANIDFTLFGSINGPFS